MDADAISEKITRIRDRLAGIETRRRRLPKEAFDERATLMDEEHRLEAQLGELRALAARAGAGIAERSTGAQTGLTHTPRLSR